MKNILLTGIPRAGTTLAAALLDAQADTVCLNEPGWQHASPALDAAGFARAVAEDFVAIRKKLLAGVPVPDRRAADGGALTNYYGSDGKEIFKTLPFVREGLTPNFTLAMKHNGPYLAVLPELVALKQWEIRAVIRHPLPVLRSWRRLNLPVSRGELPGANAYWPEMKALTGSTLPLLEKQAKMLELMWVRVLEYSAQIRLIRYEELSPPGTWQISHQPTDEDEALLSALKRHAPRAMAQYE